MSMSALHQLTRGRRCTPGKVYTQAFGRQKVNKSPLLNVDNIPILFLIVVLLLLNTLPVYSVAAETSLAGSL